MSLQVSLRYIVSRYIRIPCQSFEVFVVGALVLGPGWVPLCSVYSGVRAIRMRLEDYLVKSVCVMRMA